MIRILIEADDVQDGAINHEKAEILLDLFLLVAPTQDCEKTLEQSYASIVNSPSIIIENLE